VEENDMSKQRYAALVRNGQVIGEAFTSATNGSIVSYGKALPGGGIHEYGRAKVSREKKKMAIVDMVNLQRYDVNDGGGEPY
jgi:hypothetical protein